MLFMLRFDYFSSDNEMMSAELNSVRKLVTCISSETGESQVVRIWGNSKSSLFFRLCTALSTLISLCLTQLNLELHEKLEIRKINFIFFLDPEF